MRLKPDFCPALAALILTAVASPASSLTPAQLQFFENKIRPVLVEHCYKCHSQSSEKIKGGLTLDTREGSLKGGDSGSAVVPGHPEKSLLVKAVRYTDPDLQMPPNDRKLSSAQIADLEEWIRMGAPDPRDGIAVVRNAVDEGKNHWAFQPIKKPAVPDVSRFGSQASTNPIDAFIVPKLATNGLKPNPPAGPRTLIRRVTFDLTGLPPTPQEVAAFEADSLRNPHSAILALIDRLLASPRYGERWGRHWLDVARYSDTKGEVRRFRETPNYPHAWTYRDYVIKSFNDDKPFNRFILEQLAADLLPTSAKDRDTLAALGFVTVGDRFMGQQNDIINDRIDVVTKGFLGLTVSCARCHDHKFDPIPTKDYYSLHGVFANSREPEQFPILQMPSDQKAYAEFYTRYTNATHQLARLEQELRSLRRKGEMPSPQKRRELQRESIRALNDLDRLEMTHPGAPSRAMALTEARVIRDSPVLIRGEADNKGPMAPRQFLEVLAGPNRQTFKRGSGRLELAQAIADPKNPLTARVIVNRVWQHHFGEGFVSTPDDLGTMSTPPSYQELLDWLATRFIEEGWSLKQLHRLICTSAVYQQSTADNPRAAAVDPQNRLLWRQNIQRLEFEAIRDSLLAISGKLDLTMGGRPVDLAQEPNSARRTVYARVDRQNVPEIMNHFDFANPDMPTGKRYITTVPQQALFFMNSPLVIEAAKSLVSRMDFRTQSTIEGRIRTLYEVLYQRLPRPEELQLGVEFVSQEPSAERIQTVANPDFRKARELRQKGNFKELMQMRQEQRRAGRVDSAPRDPLTAWQEYAHALLQSNELIFIQ